MLRHLAKYLRELPADRLASYGEPKFQNRPVKFLIPLIELINYLGGIFPPFIFSANETGPGRGSMIIENN